MPSHAQSIADAMIEHYITQKPILKKKYEAHLKAARTGPMK